MAILSWEDFEEEYIPDLTNTPQDDVNEFRKRFDTDDEIIVYCVSKSCPVGLNTAEGLESRGFENVNECEEDLTDWKE